MKNVEKKGGFFNLPSIKSCQDPSHNPPTHLWIPPGQGYRHVCPRCGNTIDLVPPQITL